MCIKNFERASLLKHHKGKLAALREHERKHWALLKGQFHEPSQAINHSSFQRHKSNHKKGDQKRKGLEHTKIYAHAHRHEKKAEQQAFEGLNVCLQLAPIFALSQQHASEKRTQRHREPDELHQRGNRHHEQERRGCKDLRRFAASNPAQRVAQ